jgi:hypothetical protein
VWDVSLLDNTTSLVTPVRFTGMLGSLCGPCEEVAGNQITHIDTVPVAQSNSDYRTLQHQANVFATIMVPKSKFLDPSDDIIEWKRNHFKVTDPSDGSPEALLNHISSGCSPDLQMREIGDSIPMRRASLARRD